MRTRLALPPQLTNALLFGALLVAWLLFAPTQLGGQAAFIIVNGNSMEPLYYKGDLVIIHTAPSYGVGDIVTYRHPEIGPVIHRIIGRDGERWVFQGDHNNFVDPYHPLTSELLGRAWLHIPTVGKLLTLVRQSPLLLALVLGGGVIVMMLSPQSKDGKRRTRRRERPAGQPTRGASSAREWALTLLGVLAMVSLALAGFALTQPLSREVTDSLPYRQQGSFSYSADAPPGLYDAGSAQPGEPVFRQLSRALSVDFDYQFASDDPPTDLRGTYDLTAVLSAQNGWKHMIALAGPRPLSAAQISVHGMIELSLLNALIAQFEEQTGLKHQEYILAIIPHVEIESALGGAPLRDSFAPSLEFRIDEVQLQMISGEGGKNVLRPAQEATLSRTRSEPNMISPLGIRLDVALARQGALIAAAVCLGLAALIGLLLRGARQSEDTRIQMRYGALMVDLVGPPDMRAARVVRIGSIHDLAKLAERQGALILRDGSTPSPRYIVQDGGAVYVYGAIGPVDAELPTPVSPSAPAAEIDLAAAEEPWQERFLQALRETGLTADACHSIGIDMVTVYRERDRSAEFAQAWKDARLAAWQRHTLKGQAQ